MGTSPVHAETVALIQNLKTGYFSLQYHVAFDNSFETFYADEVIAPDTSWENLCIFNKYQMQMQLIYLLTLVLID